MPRLNCTFGEFLAIISDHGFVLHRQAGGSHQIWRKAVGSNVYLVTVASHGDRAAIPKGTLQSMIRQSGLSPKLFRK